MSLHSHHILIYILVSAGKFCNSLIPVTSSSHEIQFLFFNVLAEFLFMDEMYLTSSNEHSRSALFYVLQTSKMFLACGAGHSFWHCLRHIILWKKSEITARYTLRSRCFWYIVYSASNPLWNDRNMFCDSWQYNRKLWHIVSPYSGHNMLFAAFHGSYRPMSGISTFIVV